MLWRTSKNLRSTALFVTLVDIVAHQVLIAGQGGDDQVGTRRVREANPTVCQGRLAVQGWGRYVDTGQRTLGVIVWVSADVV